MKRSEKLKAEKGLVSPSACYWPDHLGEVQHLGLSPLAFPRDEEAILVNLDDDYHDKVQLVKYGCSKDKEFITYKVSQKITFLEFGV